MVIYFYKFINLGGKKWTFFNEREDFVIFLYDTGKQTVSINYFLSNKSVDIIVCYNFEENWDVEAARDDLNRLWRKFNPAFIGYDTKCYVIKNFYAHCNKFGVEYIFPMKFFNIDNFHSEEFKIYDAKYRRVAFSKHKFASV